MRWRQKTLIPGTVRVVTRFLFFPKCINGVCRWLEYATYKQQYKDGYSSEDTFIIGTILVGRINNEK